MTMDSSPSSPIDIFMLLPESAVAIMSVMDTAFDPAFSEAWTLEQCRSTLLLPGSSLWAASLNGEIVGFAMALTVMENSELLLLAVAPHAQNKGIGTLLLESWQDMMRAAGVSHLFLEVRSGNGAQEFYTGRGFSVIGRRPNYYHGQGETRHDALTLGKSLKY